MTTMLLDASAVRTGPPPAVGAVRTGPPAALAARSAGATSRWVVEVGANKAGRPLLIFPHAGAGPSAYRRLGQAMLGRFRPLVVHLPGRETRLDDSPCHDLSALVQSLARAVAPLVASGSAFYGHSMGALLAFELARQLRRAYGIEPDHLVVSGYAAPRVPTTGGRHLLTDEALWDSVCAMLGTPPEVAADPRMRALLLPAVRADFEACETYRYRAEPALDCPISSFAGDRDEEAPPAQMSGWSAETGADYRQETVPGNHFFNLSDGGFPTRLLRTLT